MPGLYYRPGFYFAIMTALIHFAIMAWQYWSMRVLCLGHLGSKIGISLCTYMALLNWCSKENPSPASFRLYWYPHGRDVENPCIS